MDAEVWPDERVVRFVNDSFLPARVHVKDPDNAFKRISERFQAPWTPTILLLDPSGAEQHRIEGFLPTEDFLPKLISAAGGSRFTSSSGRTRSAAIARSSSNSPTPMRRPRRCIGRASHRTKRPAILNH